MIEKCCTFLYNMHELYNMHMKNILNYNSMIFAFSKINLIYIKYFKLIYNLNKTVNNNFMLCKFNYSNSLIQYTG